MKKLIVTLGVFLLFTSCMHEAQSKSQEGIDFEVEFRFEKDEVKFLFEKDGVKMYRFYDNGRFHYYTDKGETIVTQQAGKNSTFEENIQ